MAHSARTFRWLEDLIERGEIQPGATVLELGPQDVCYYAGSEEERVLNQSCAIARDWYAIKGFGRYASIDLNDERATFRRDLNEPIGDACPRPDALWDIVYDGGTAEHVFNIGEVFRTAHLLCAPGGLMLHCLPLAGEVDHGFWNVHPRVYRGLAEANGYDVVDLFQEDIDGAVWMMLGHDRPNPEKIYGFAALRRPADHRPFAYPQQR